MYAGQIDEVGAIEIIALDLGCLTVPPGTPMGEQVLPVLAFVVDHPQGVLLFDTGLGTECAAYDRLITPVRRSLEGALAAANVRLTDVRAVVNCHLHYDHSGGNPLFPRTPIWVQAREYEAAGDLAYVIAERVDFPGAQLRVIDGEAEVLPGVRVVPSPGHTPGHQSLVIEASEGPIILAGQAAYTVDEFIDPEREPARGLKTAYDQVEFLNSLARLRALEPKRIFFSHDQSVWEPPG